MKRQANRLSRSFVIATLSLVNSLVKRVILTAFFVLTFLLSSVPSATARDKIEGSALNEIAPVQTLDTNWGSVSLKTLASVQAPQSLEPFIISVELVTPLNVVPSHNDLAGSYGDFYLELLDEEKTDSSDKVSIFTKSWKAYPNNRGKVSLPPIPIRLELRDDNQEAYTMHTPPLTFDIPLIDAPGSIDVIKADFSPIKSFPFLPCVLSAIFVSVAVMLLCLKRKSSDENTVSKQVAEVSPYEKAICRLEDLKKSRLYLENENGFYTEIASVLRNYLTEKFRLNAEEKTTHEILSTIDGFSGLKNDWRSAADIEFTNSTDISEDQYKAIAYETLKKNGVRSLLESALLVIDLVKFAKRPTTFDDASRIFEQVRKLIDEAERSFNEGAQQFKSALRSDDRQDVSSETPLSSSAD